MAKIKPLNDKIIVKAVELLWLEAVKEEQNVKLLLK